MMYIALYDVLQIEHIHKHTQRERENVTRYLNKILHFYNFFFQKYIECINYCYLQNVLFTLQLQFYNILLKTFT